MSVLILCPTRGRPSNAARLAGAVRRTASGPVELAFLIDRDDPALDGYRDALRAYPPPPGGPVMFRAYIELGEPARIGTLLNWSGTAKAHTFRHVGFLGDDHVPRTHGWDEALTGEVDRMGGGLAYGNDLIQGPNLPTAVVMSADIPRTLGYMVPGGLEHLFIDNAWKALGEETGRLAYRDDVIVEHMHPLVGKAEPDGTYARANDPGQWAADEERYVRWRDNDLAREAALLRAVWRG